MKPRKKSVTLFDSFSESDSSTFEPFLESLRSESENKEKKRNGLVIFGEKSTLELFMKNLDFFYRLDKVLEFKSPHEYFGLCYKINVNFKTLNFVQVLSRY
jgi:hypothetical protein